MPAGTIQPAKAIEGIISLPGDKSIARCHRGGQTSIANYSTGV
jgi:hypothetical protein